MRTLFRGSRFDCSRLAFAAQFLAVVAVAVANADAVVVSHKKHPTQVCSTNVTSNNSRKQ